MSYTVSVIDEVWGGQPVGHALLIHNGYVFVGYYDADRMLTVASRAQAGGEWCYRRLDSQVGWDSHNNIRMTVDDRGRLHVVANMHVSPLTYFMSDETDPLASLRKIAFLVDPDQEQQMTYPVFLRDADGQMLLQYRDGMSGQGNEIFNVFDADTAKWYRLASAPFIDGEGERNAYIVGPLIGPDGLFHATWVWRDTPAAETNHDLSYAKSADLIHWQKANGSPLLSPITLASAEIVDPVPVRCGMINYNTLLGFDDDANPLIAYHKFDHRGDTQIFLARHKNGAWRIVKASRWRGYKWHFEGGGSLYSEVRLLPPQQVGDEIHIHVFRRERPCLLRLKAGSLSYIGQSIPPPQPFAKELARLRTPKGLVRNQQLAQSGDQSYLIVWFSLPVNRDQPADFVPEPSKLLLFETGRPSETVATLNSSATGTIRRCIRRFFVRWRH